MKTGYRVIIFYDGHCSVCNKEMDYYKKKDPLNKIHFLDITSEEFRSSSYSSHFDEMMKEMHALSSKGKMLRGMDAFYLLWQELDLQSFLRFLMGISLFKLFFHIGYFIFARGIRPFLKQK